MGIIYKLTSPPGKVYIGQCKRKHRKTRVEHPPQKQMRMRWREHCSATSGCVAIKKAIAKYGAKNFCVEILLCAPDDDLNHYERHFVAMYDSFNPKYGYNRNEGGEGGGFGIPSVRKAQCEPGSKWMRAVTDPGVVKRKIVAMHSQSSREKVAVTKAKQTAAAVAALPESQQAEAAAKKRRLAEATARWRARQRGVTDASVAKRPANTGTLARWAAYRKQA